VRFTGPGPRKTRANRRLREESMRTVFVVTWSLIVAGLAIYTVVAAAGL
jgi:hypothetical protein